MADYTLVKHTVDVSVAPIVTVSGAAPMLIVGIERMDANTTEMWSFEQDNADITTKRILFLDEGAVEDLSSLFDSEGNFPGIRQLGFHKFGLNVKAYFEVVDTDIAGNA